MKFLFVGLGSIGQRHLRNLLVLKPDALFFAVRSGRQNSLVLNEDNVPVEDVSLAEYYQLREFSNLETALKVDPDIVFITNPTGEHLAAAELVLLLSNAFVFMEKPVSSDLLEVERLLEIEKKFGSKRVQVGFQYRFHPILLKAKALLSDSVIGNLVSADFVNGEDITGWHPYEDYRNSYAAKRSLGGGAIFTQIHELDYMIWMLGMPKCIFCIGGKLSSLELDVEDSVGMLIGYSGEFGIIPASVKLDYLRKPAVRQFQIIGDRGRIEGDLLSNSMRVLSEAGEWLFEASEFSRNDMFLKILNNLLLASEGIYEEGFVGLSEAYRSHVLAAAAKRSLTNGQVEVLN